MSDLDKETQERLWCLQALVTYLLYEKREETQVRNAFAALVQERHANFHDKKDEGTSFEKCGNDLCKKALDLLADAQSPTIEMNAFGLQMIQPFNLKYVLSSESKILKAWLVDKEESKIINPSDEPTIIKI